MKMSVVSVTRAEVTSEIDVRDVRLSELTHFTISI